MTTPYRSTLTIGLFAALMFVTATSGVAAPPSASTIADGQRDFDWEIGTWRSTVQVLADPLSDSPD